MGFFSNLFSGGNSTDGSRPAKKKRGAVDPEDLTLPDEIPTSRPGLVLKKAEGAERIDIEIVGESFRAKDVAAVAAAAEGAYFDIYLIAQPTNAYDKNAVMVMAANKHVGYIAKSGSKQWAKLVNEATERQELLWGRARAISREGTSNTGIFGYIYMPRKGKDIEDLLPKKLTAAALTKAIDKVIDLSNTANDPETVTQLRSLAKKGATAAAPLGAHALWVAQNPDGQDVDAWSDIETLCDDVLDGAAEAAYATDPYEVDVLGTIEELAAAVHSIEESTK